MIWPACDIARYSEMRMITGHKKGEVLMTEDHWRQNAELIRKPGGMALAPDPPIWIEGGEVAAGSLSAMLDLWSALPASHQRHHTIGISGGSLSEIAIRGLLEQPRYVAD
jgi:hypothetical protein